jgi:hypothetical protein
MIEAVASRAWGGEIDRRGSFPEVVIRWDIAPAIR